VIDGFCKLVIGWSIHHRLDRQMAVAAFEMAVLQRQGGWSVILHSDRGSQFLCSEYQVFLKRNTLPYSMIALGTAAIMLSVRDFSECSIGIDIGRWI
jgi:putative transposase